MTTTALITGAAKRLGQAMAMRLAQRGWDIALHYGASQAAAEATASQIRALGRRCELVQADLDDAAQVRQLVAQAAGKIGPLSLLINCASIFEPSEFLQTEEELFDRHFAVNFRTPFFLARDFARQCDSGMIVNFVDANHTKSAQRYFAYMLSKKALAEFTTMAAKTLAPGIRVNGICPGPILPPPGGTAQTLQTVADKVPMHRPGTLAEITAGLDYLLDNHYVTGQLLYIDGGQHIV